MKYAFGGLLAACTLALALPALAQDSDGSAKALIDGLHFRSGEVEVAEAGAHFNLGSQFRYLDKADTRKVLEQLWGNPEDDTVLGMVVPTHPSLEEDGSWAVVVTYEAEGYVSDADAAKIDYDALLKNMKEGTQEANAEREKAGYGRVDLVGWAVPPRYDASNKKLYWAKELAFSGQPSHTLNYDIRVLGRHGYLSLNAVSGMDELPQVQTGMQQLLPMTDFNAGARYADHNPSTDKVAAYGVAALIGGGLAAKTGLLAKLGLILAKLGKLLFVGAIALVAGIKKFFSARRDRASGTVR
ncbi:Uncharacterized membrane-anchored protein [Pseudoxanthomonas sp. GM95]|uniref:DUF2167 domain-containing protein n=1 Tax=Pseudoxanthomonas sp. GM95 TaxID=1881043 RepID=UPI0008AAE3C6|nr:DUF2167 domain-containing protein [Pseudoxanthomonas sp. GM95]SEM41588.1 Uncharacterized membrane-anchored protein [Pseudoxanthomonas sp. GM95]